MSVFTCQMQNNAYKVIYDTLFCQILILCNEGKIGKKYLKIEGIGIPKNGSTMYPAKISFRLTSIQIQSMMLKNLSSQ